MRTHLIIVICVMMTACRRSYLNHHLAQRITAHSVPEMGLTVTIAIRGHVPVRDSSQGPHPSLAQPPEMEIQRSRDPV